MDSYTCTVASRLPGIDFAPDFFDAGNAPVQALSGKDRKLNLRDIEPAAMFRRVVPLDPLGNSTGLGRLEPLIESGRAMCIQVVRHENDAFRIRIVDVDQQSELFCKV